MQTFVAHIVASKEYLGSNTFMFWNYLNFFKIWVYGVLTWLVISFWGAETGMDLIVQWTIVVIIIDVFILDFRWDRLIGKAYRKYVKKDLKPKTEIEFKECRYCGEYSTYRDGIKQ